MNRLLARLVIAAAVLCWAPSVWAVTITPIVGESGVTAWLAEDHSVPVVTLRFAFPGGATYDPPGKGGTASMVAATLDEGSGPYDTTEFHTRLENLATRLSFSAGQDEFGGSMRMLKRNVGESAELLRLSLTDPHFTPEDIERIRAEIVAILQRQARNPRSLSSRLWMHTAFEAHPYGANTDGTEASVAAITRDDLVAFAQRRIQRKGLVLAVVGDITATEAAALIDHVFGGLPSREGAPQIPEAEPADAGALIVSRSPVPQSVVTFGQSGIKRADPDWYAALVLNDVLGGGGFRGRLMQEIREKRGLAYGVSTELVPYRHAGLVLGSVATENARVRESIELVRAEWKRMREDGPSEAELQRAKTYLTGSFPLGLDSTQHVAAVLLQMQLDGLGADYLDRRADLINGVTLEQARRVAKRLYDPDRLSFVVVGNPADVTPIEPPRPANR